jgi:hypothetical protein
MAQADRVRTEGSSSASAGAAEGHSFIEASSAAAHARTPGSGAETSCWSSATTRRSPACARAVRAAFRSPPDPAASGPSASRAAARDSGSDARRARAATLTRRSVSSEAFFTASSTGASPRGARLSATTRVSVGPSWIARINPARPMPTSAPSPCSNVVAALMAGTPREVSTTHTSCSRPPDASPARVPQAEAIPPRRGSSPVAQRSRSASTTSRVATRPMARRAASRARVSGSRRTASSSRGESLGSPASAAAYMALRRTRASRSRNRARRFSPCEPDTSVRAPTARQAPSSDDTSSRHLSPEAMPASTRKNAARPPAASCVLARCDTRSSTLARQPRISSMRATASSGFDAASSCFTTARAIARASCPPRVCLLVASRCLSAA